MLVKNFFSTSECCMGRLEFNILLISRRSIMYTDYITWIFLYIVLVYLCHGSWIHNISQNSSVHYLVTTPLSRTSRGVRRYCFMYQTNEDSSLIHFTSTSDTCHRDSIIGADGALSFNITPIGSVGKFLWRCKFAFLVNLLFLTRTDLFPEDCGRIFSFLFNTFSHCFLLIFNTQV